MTPADRLEAAYVALWLAKATYDSLWAASDPLTPDSVLYAAHRNCVRAGRIYREARDAATPTQS